MRLLFVLCWLTLVARADDPPAQQAARQRLEAALKEHNLQLADPDPRVSRLAQEMTRYQRRRPVPWRYLVVRADFPNAGCTGEGVIYVTTGLLSLELDDDELAGILAHEIAHGLLRHVEANLWQAERAEQTRREREEVLRQVEDLARQKTELPEAEFLRRQAQLVERARELRRRIDALRAEAYYSSAGMQKQELEADQLGLQLARRAGFRPDGLPRALAKLQENRSEAHDLGGFSHPPVSERLQHLRDMLQFFR